LYNFARSIESKLRTESLGDQDALDFSNALKDCEVAKLKELAPKVKAGLSERQFLCFVIPIERELKKRIDDSEILVTTEDQSTKVAKQHDLIVVLDNIRSAFNVGAIFRTCDALGVCEVLITGYTPGPKDLKVKKTAMKAESNLRVRHFRDLLEVTRYLREQGYSLVGVETSPSAKPIQKTDLPLKSALVFGNERFGLTPSDLKGFDKIVNLPVFGLKNSLNINAAVTACGYEWIRQHGKF
jgi:tRNA G18 (ribose-2'-O)-methylase SpoU